MSVDMATDEKLDDNSFIHKGIITFPEGKSGHDRFTVTKSHRLIEAQTLLTSREQKILAACISLINPLGIYPNGITVELEDEHIEALTGIEKRHIYRFIDQAAKKFHSIPIETPGKKKGTISYINIAHKSEYDPELRKLIIKFHEEMEDELVQLSQYTSVELKHLVKLTSKYSIRLYEILSKQYNKQKGGTQFFKVRLEDLFYPLGLKDLHGNVLASSYLRNFATFKDKVLVPACKDIVANSNLDVTYTPFKSGRSVAGLTFSIKHKTQKIEADTGVFKLPLAYECLDISEAVTFLGLSHDLLVKWKSQYSEHVIQTNLFYFLTQLQEGLDVKKPAAYLTKLFKFNIANLPDVANPYSIKYKTNKDGFEFVRRVAMPIWWSLPEDLRVDLVTAGSFSLHRVTSDMYKAFVGLSKTESYDESEALYDSEYALQEWLDAWCNKT
jgi:plasmid replication initiation protein